jgi:hypothetical protein
MSNCIQIELSQVTLNSLQFRVRDYQKLIEGHRPHLERPHALPADDYVCWFLAQNSSFQDGSVTIDFGCGRSSHTWRDFRWVIWFLSQYFIIPTRHSFVISDESDGFKRKHTVTVNWPYKSVERVLQDV